MPPKILGDQSGFSLVSALMGIAIMGVLATSWSQLQVKQARTQKVSEQRVEGMALSREIIDSVDCGKTFPPGAPVPASGPIALLNSAGGPVIPSGGKRSGDWFIRAYVEPGSTRNIQVYKLQPKPGATNALNFTANPNSDEYLQDPLKRPLSWQHANAKVFTQGMSPCFSRLNGTFSPLDVLTARVDALTLKVQTLEAKIQGVEAKRAAINTTCPQGSFIAGITDNGAECKAVWNQNDQNHTTKVNEENPGHYCPTGYLMSGVAVNFSVGNKLGNVDVQCRRVGT